MKPHDTSALDEAIARYKSDDPLLTATEVAAILEVHIETVRRWMRLGIIAFETTSPPTVRRPRRRVRRSEAERHRVKHPGVDDVPRVTPRQ